MDQVPLVLLVCLVHRATEDLEDLRVSQADQERTDPMDCQVSQEISDLQDPVDHQE